TNLCLNYLGDTGKVGLGTTVPSVSFAFVAPANGNFVLAFSSNGTGLCNSYSGTVAGLFDQSASSAGPCATCPATTMSASVPDGTVTVPYNFTITASGGTGPYTFYLTSGSLPPGLSMDTSGNITGTPTFAGSFDFTVQATDVNGCSGSQSYT